MTKKDYEKLALWLGTSGAKEAKLSTYQIETLAITLAMDVLAPDNSRFDPSKFAKRVLMHAALRV